MGRTVTAGESRQWFKWQEEQARLACLLLIFAEIFPKTMLLRIVKGDRWLLWETKYSSLQKLPRGIRMFTTLGAQPSWREFQHSMEKWSSLQPLVCTQGKRAKIINSSPRVALPRELSGGFYRGKMIAHRQSLPLGGSLLQPAVQPQEGLTGEKHLGPSAWPNQLSQRVTNYPHLLPASSLIL